MSSADMKKSGLPPLRMNKFFVSKRASMFEVDSVDPRQEDRERSPCGMLDLSERRMRARKERERKKEMVQRRKRQADPYAEQSTDTDEKLTEIDCNSNNKKESRLCPHATNSVNLNLVKKTLKQAPAIGLCTQCRKLQTNQSEPNNAQGEYVPVIWMCMFCGHQGCDRNSTHGHALLHYRTPRSDPHCLILNTHTWTVWCYNCDCEVIQTSTKKLHVAVETIKRLNMSGKRVPTSRNPSRATTPLPSINSAFSKGTSSFDDGSKTLKSHRNSQTDLSYLPKVKGLSNLGNTCFFNSVLQNLAQTHMLNQLFDVQMQSGQRIYLPGRQKNPLEQDRIKIDRYMDRNNFDNTNDNLNHNEDDDDENDEDIELKPLDLHLAEGGGLSLALSVFLKDMNAVGKNGLLNPGHLFGQMLKKNAQFRGYEQQDAHELLRCLLDAIRNEEIIRIKKSILKAFALSEKSDPKSVSPKLKKIICGYGKQATHTIVDQIFGGHMLSTVFCEECHCSSQVFEPFMDLSLPVNEEKGRPGKQTPPEEDCIFDCFGRATNQNTKNISKHSLKKQKKEEKKKKKRGGRNTGGSSKTNPLTPSCIKANGEDEVYGQAAQRLTEKRRPGDIEEMQAREEEQKRALELAERSKDKKGKESSKFRSLAQIRNANRKDDDDEEGGSNDRDVESDEELEYDTEEHEDDDDISLGGRRHSLGSTNSLNRLGAKISQTSTSKQEKISETEEEEDDSEEDDSDEETEETDDEEDSDEESSSNKKDSSAVDMSDADVEDNTDSEWLSQSQFRNTRQPSIVVETMEGEVSPSEDNLNYDHRYLSTSNSADQLNYYTSASETSDRYFTASDAGKYCNGADTGDDEKDKRWDKSRRKVYDGDKRGSVDQSHLDDLSHRMSDMKMKRKSNSKESLLDTHLRLNHKRGSMDTLHPFNTDKIMENDELYRKKTLNIKKLRQEWIARSLTTLSPRYQCKTQECSIMSCLTSFTAPELMTGGNKITCDNCTKLYKQMHPDDDSVKSIKTNASKQMLILSPPAVLTLQLKRFHHVGYNLSKVNRFVQFPLVLDLAPFTSSISACLNNMNKGQTQVLYGLYGVVEHSGRLNSGHYVAYVRSRPMDPARTNKQLLNLKPSSSYEINNLVREMADKLEAEGSSSSKQESKKPHNSLPQVKIEEYEEEIRSGHWFHVSDSYVSEITIDRVLKAQAYLLFYERLV